MARRFNPDQAHLLLEGVRHLALALQPTGGRYTDIHQPLLVPQEFVTVHQHLVRQQALCKIGG